MLVQALSFTLAGLEAYPVTIETDITSGLPLLTLVGSPDNTVKANLGRIKFAIKNSGFSFPAGRITINLAPADVKEEFALDGPIPPVKGTLPNKILGGFNVFQNI